jgi:hypothetical protein
MRVWVFAWLMATFVTLVVLGAFLASMVSAAVQLGRAAQRFQREVGEIADDISRGAARAGDREARDRERRRALGQG